MKQKNQQINKTSEKKSGLLSYLLLLTTFFILFEISLFIQSSEIYLGDFKLVADRLKVPASVIPGILYFIFIQLSLHVLFTVLIWGMARLIAIALHSSWKTTEKIAFGLWIIGIITVLLANQHYFPNSRFALLSLYIMHSAYLAKLLFYLFSFIFFISLTLAFYGFLIAGSHKLKVGLGVFSLVTIILLNVPSTQFVIRDASTIDKPNIILIGIDSLRPDFLSFFGHDEETPFLDKFLNQSTVFAEALTPLARTFPAWISILTGEYPKVSGVRFNLPTARNMNWSHTLPAILRQHGYETIFSTDETRFSNIDESLGFDKIITPPIGFNDFLLGNLNDFPLSNLLVNSSLGKYLFPHSYANRPVFMTYDPNSYLELLKENIPHSRTKPLFLAVHFCLPHYPYFWGRDAANNKSIYNYQASVKRVDQQFQDYLKILAEDKLLEHSIVVLLSDHGEALELSGDRITASDLFVATLKLKLKQIPHFYPPSSDDESVDQSAGHGTDVLGLTQYHTVLAFRLYGLKPNHIAVLPGRVSLLDIKPTLFDFLNHPTDAKDSGKSLKNSILGKRTINSSNQDFFIESDFSPQAVRSIHPETRQLLFEGINYFQIDPDTARITVKSEMAKLIISSKQYADLYHEWILAFYPQNKKEMMPILVNLDTGEWTNDLRSEFAKNSPASHMMHALKHFYGNEITKIESFPS